VLVLLAVTSLNIFWSKGMRSVFWVILDNKEL